MHHLSFYTAGVVAFFAGLSQTLNRLNPFIPCACTFTYLYMSLLTIFTENNEWLLHTIDLTVVCCQLSPLVSRLVGMSGHLTREPCMLIYRTTQISAADLKCATHSGSPQSSRTCMHASYAPA